MMKHHSEVVNYSNLDFKAIHKEMMADEDIEGAKANGQVEGDGERKGPKDAQTTPLDKPLTNPSIDQDADPNVVDPIV